MPRRAHVPTLTRHASDARNALGPLSRRLQNQIAAMVEQAAYKAGATAPTWTREVRPLERPWFTTDLLALRAYLLRASPVAFRRRNLFVDATIGDRV